jgi:hypothetical protein
MKYMILISYLPPAKEAAIRFNRAEEIELEEAPF